jgi:two-component system OmpR family response regulator
VLRRTRPAAAARSLLTFADIELDQDSYEVRRAGQLIDLSPTEFRLLRFLMRNPGRVLTRAQLLDHVWNYDFGGSSTVVSTYVAYLRRKLAAHGPDVIHTQRGIGYSLRPPRLGERPRSDAGDNGSAGSGPASTSNGSAGSSPASTSNSSAGVGAASDASSPGDAVLDAGGGAHADC